MGTRHAGRSWARRWSYWLEPKNWLIVTVVGIGWHADGRAGRQVVACSVLGAGAAALAYAAVVRLTATAGADVSR